MAHGGRPEWNEEVRASVAEFGERIPLAVAFGTADPQTPPDGPRRTRRLGRLRMHLPAEIHRGGIQSFFGSAMIFLYRWLSAEPGVPGSNRLSVLDPARGYSRSRARARFCPVRWSRPHASAKTLSLRFSSWSLRSS